MTIERWTSGYQAIMTDWYDKKSVYFAVKCYRPGQALSAPPVWEKAFLLPIDQQHIISEYFDSVACHFAQENDERKMLAMYQSGKKIVENGKRI